jgi:FKBP-type peptidyl-prolyl cis-trans isomerase (trigger factor)
MTQKNKAEKFKELAEKRVTRAIKEFRLIGNLANRKNYEYTDEHVKKIMSALRTELRHLSQRFEDGQDQDQPIFKL